MSTIRKTTADVEEICQEAIAKLRQNKGSDITFNSLSGSNNGWDDPIGIVSVYFLSMHFHGESIKLALQGDVFFIDTPTSQEEEGILIGTKDHKQMIILRVAKIIYEYYKNWLKGRGLANKISNAPIDNTPPVYTNQSGTVNQLHIGSKIIDISDRYARSSIDDLQDELDQEKQKNRVLQDRLDMLEAALRSKGLM